jgi:[ribosomal protein S18]-alanine N-acetyltransferase
MSGIVSRLLPNASPVFSAARPTDAAPIAALHAASFQRGWDEDEVRRLLADSAVAAHRAVIRRKIVGFVISRIAADEAEILSVAIAPARRGHGLSQPMLEFHLRSLAGRGARAVFLEVDEQNTPARRLYSRGGFYEVGRRPSYYGGNATALVLRRDLV